MTGQAKAEPSGKKRKTGYFSVDKYPLEALSLRCNGREPGHRGATATGDSECGNVPLSVVKAQWRVPGSHLPLCQSQSHDHDGNGREAGGGIGFGADVQQTAQKEEVSYGLHLQA